MTGNKFIFLVSIEEQIVEQGFSIVKKDFERPWGGFFVIDENQTEAFVQRFFSDVLLADIMIGNRLSPKFLVVAPHKRLSWQYHNRRAELWRVTQGIVGVVQSSDDIENELNEYHVNDTIVLPCNERHRLVGLNDWGVVAEIWQHTDIGNPSDEADIVRLQDDFGR